MKKALRRLFAAILVIVLAIAVGTFIPRPLFAPAHSEDAAERRRILVLSNPIHSDIVVPLADDTRAAFGFLEHFGVPVTDPAAKWLVIGWGGRAFYIETPTWADLKPMPVFRALTVDNSVLHVDVAGDLDENHPAISAFDLDPDQFLQLSAFIQASFVREAGQVVAAGDTGYGAYDRFFEAKGYFNAFLGCNTWTAAALRTAGLRTGFWNPLPQTLTLSLELFN